MRAKEVFNKVTDQRWGKACVQHSHRHLQMLCGLKTLTWQTQSMHKAFRRHAGRKSCTEQCHQGHVRQSKITA